MIGKLTGEYGGVLSDGLALVEVGGVGYTVRLPAQAGLLRYPLREGQRVSLYIHTAVREDAIDLFGFATQEELAFFKLLMSVSGIGPKSALSILSAADVEPLKRAIVGGNASMLTTTFGIGKKSAERLVVELRDKIVLGAASGAPAAHAAGGDDADILEALLGLGYSAAESRAALKEITSTPGDMRARLAAALRHLGTRTTA